MNSLLVIAMYLAIGLCPTNRVDIDTLRELQGTSQSGTWYTLSCNPTGYMVHFYLGDNGKLSSLSVQHFANWKKDGLGMTLINSPVPFGPLVEIRVGFWVHGVQVFRTRLEL